MKKYYLIKEQVKDRTYFTGVNGSGFPTELKLIPEGFCYISEKQAQRAAQKRNEGNPQKICSVVEVPAQAVVPGEFFPRDSHYETARRLLAGAGCPDWCYKNSELPVIMQDLKIEVPEMPDHEAVRVAYCLRRIGDDSPEPPKPKKAEWLMVFDTGDCVDGIGFDSFDAAKADAEDTLMMWMVECEMYHPGDADEWDKLISNSSVEVKRLNPESGEYEEYWTPTYEDEEALGWVEWERYSKIRQEHKRAANNTK